MPSSWHLIQSLPVCPSDLTSLVLRPCAVSTLFPTFVSVQLLLLRYGNIVHFTFSLLRPW